MVHHSEKIIEGNTLHHSAWNEIWSVIASASRLANLNSDLRGGNTFHKLKNIVDDCSAVLYSYAHIFYANMVFIYHTPFSLS